MFWFVSQLRRLVCPLAVVLSVFVLPSPTLVAATAFSSTTAGRIVSGSLDDWLALGMALLAALFCIQKREQ